MGRVPEGEEGTSEELPGTTSIQKTVDTPGEAKFKDTVRRHSDIPTQPFQAGLGALREPYGTWDDGLPGTGFKQVHTNLTSDGKSPLKA